MAIESKVNQQQLKTTTIYWNLQKKNLETSLFKTFSSITTNLSQTGTHNMTDHCQKPALPNAPILRFPKHIWNNNTLPQLSTIDTSTQNSSSESPSQRKWCTYQPGKRGFRFSGTKVTYRQPCLSQSCKNCTTWFPNLISPRENIPQRFLDTVRSDDDDEEESVRLSSSCGEEGNSFDIPILASKAVGSERRFSLQKPGADSRRGAMTRVRIH
jgi:hypothetical protein